MIYAGAGLFVFSSILIGFWIVFNTLDFRTIRNSLFPSGTPTMTATATPPPTSTPVPEIYNCTAFINNPLSYMVDRITGDYRTTHPKDISENPVIQSIELVTGERNPAFDELEEIHNIVYCFETALEAKVFFNDVRGTTSQTLGNYSISSKSFYGSDKYQIWFVDRNIVVQLKGLPRYSDTGAAVEQALLDQAIAVYRKISTRLPTMAP